MDLTKRFIPEQCPGCKARIEAKYSAYRHAPQHVLFYPLLAAGIVVAPGLAVYLFWTTVRDSIQLIAEMRWFNSNFGMIVFVFALISIPLTFLWLARMWWRFLHRLPRRFSYSCPGCPWKGIVKVVDLTGGAEPTPGMQVEVASSSIPTENIKLGSTRMSDRNQRRIQEQELPPNPDFDFRDS